MGCLHYDIKTVYINENNPKVWEKFVIAHEICHWLIDNNPERMWDNEELTCDRFSLWVWMPTMFDKKTNDYFMSILN